MAIEYLEKAVNLKPDLFSAYFLIGNAYAAQKKFDTAIEQYEKVSKKNPKAIQPLMMTGLFVRHPEAAAEGKWLLSEGIGHQQKLCTSGEQSGLQLRPIRRQFRRSSWIGTKSARGKLERRRYRGYAGLDSLQETNLRHST